MGQCPPSTLEFVPLVKATRDEQALPADADAGSNIESPCLTPSLPPSPQRQSGLMFARSDTGMAHNGNCARLPSKGATSFLSERDLAKYMEDHAHSKTPAIKMASRSAPMPDRP